MCDLDALRDYLRNEATLAKADPEIFSEIEKKAPLSLSLKQKRPLSDRGSNYLAKLKKNLKCVFSWMNENDITANLPFKKFETGEQVYGRPIYLTKEERNIIADADFSDQPLTLQEQRDIFGFQCQVGCRVSDLKELRPENVHDGILVYAPKKTSHNSNPINPRVPLTPQALEIIEKYKEFVFFTTKNSLFIDNEYLAASPHRIPCCSKVSGVEIHNKNVYYRFVFGFTELQYFNTQSKNKATLMLTWVQCTLSFSYPYG